MKPTLDEVKRLATQLWRERHPYTVGLTITESLYRQYMKEAYAMASVSPCHRFVRGICIPAERFGLERTA